MRRYAATRSPMVKSVTEGPMWATVPETSEPSMAWLLNQRGTLKSFGFIAAQTFLMRRSPLQSILTWRGAGVCGGEVRFGDGDWDRSEFDFEVWVDVGGFHERHCEILG